MGGKISSVAIRLALILTVTPIFTSKNTQVVISNKGKFGLLVLLIGYLPFLINGWLNARLLDRPEVFWLFEFVSWIGLPLVILVTLLRKRIVSVSGLGLHNPFGDISNGLKFLIFSLLLTISIGLVYFFV